MNKEYVLIVFDKDKDIKNYYFGEDMKEIEEKLYKIIDKTIDFEIYHTVSTRETLELVKYATERFLKNN